jgi:hypothetical protein
MVRFQGWLLCAFLPTSCMIVFARLAVLEVVMVRVSTATCPSLTFGECFRPVRLLQKEVLCHERMQSAWMEGPGWNAGGQGKPEDTLILIQEQDVHKAVALL